MNGRWIALPLLLLIMSGCATVPVEEDGVVLGDRFDESALAMGTSSLLSEVYSAMVAVTADAARATTDTRTQEAVIRWRINTARRLDEIRAIQDPRLRFSALWALLAQFRLEAHAGTAPSIFGETASMYKAFAEEFERRALLLGYSAFPDSIIDSAAEEIEIIAQTAGPEALLSPSSAVRQGRGAIEQIISIPLSPISGLQGVGDTPTAINRFTDAATGMARVVENIPERTRWQVELMLVQAQTGGVLASFLQEFATTREVIERFGGIVAGLPVQVREIVDELETVQQPLGENLDKINQALALVGEASAGIEGAIAESAKATEAINRTISEAQAGAASVESAAAEVRRLVAEVKGPEDQRQSGDGQAAEIDIAEVAGIARSIELAAADLRSGIAELRQLERLPAIEQSRETVSRLIWQASISVGVLILLAFLGGLVLIGFGRRGGRAA